MQRFHNIHKKTLSTTMKPINPREKKLQNGEHLHWRGTKWQFLRGSSAIQKNIHRNTYSPLVPILRYYSLSQTNKVNVRYTLAKIRLNMKVGCSEGISTLKVVSNSSRDLSDWLWHEEKSQSLSYLAHRTSELAFQPEIMHFPLDPPFKWDK